MIRKIYKKRALNMRSADQIDSFYKKGDPFELYGRVGYAERELNKQKTLF